MSWMNDKQNPNILCTYLSIKKIVFVKYKILTLIFLLKDEIQVVKQFDK